MADYVLLHGAWRSGWVWQTITKQLRKARHPVYARSLTGLAERRHLLTSGASLETHVEDMTDKVLICGDSSLTAICFMATLPTGTHNEKTYVKHKIEIFSAGCKTGKDTIETVKKLADSEHEVVVHDIHQQEIASRAAQHGVRRLPAVLVNGKLAGCCARRGVEEQVLP